MKEREGISMQEKEVEEKELRIAEYKAFIESLLNKHKELEKFSKGMKGLRETAIKQDHALLKQAENFFDEAAKAAKEKKFEEKTTPFELINNLKEEALKVINAGLKGRREIDKYFDSSVENLLLGLESIDKLIADKIIELINNIEQSHASELERLKIQIADLVTTNEELRREVEALRLGIPKKPKEIPSLEEAMPVSLQCPICLQTHEVAAGTVEFKCPICSHLIKTR